MSEEMVIRCCAPTLAAIKTGSLFNCAFESQEDMTQSLRCVNRCILHKGVCAIPLRFHDGKALIYLYRAAMLEQDLNQPLAEEILRAYGYPKTGMMARIMFLIARLKECGTFPHEIGLFLGYPPADVKGFIEGKPCKCTGLWKVFESDETEAKRYFARCRHLHAGLSAPQRGRMEPVQADNSAPAVFIQENPYRNEGNCMTKLAGIESNAWKHCGPMAINEPIGPQLIYE